jgi:hypothetical protein
MCFSSHRLIYSFDGGVGTLEVGGVLVLPRHAYTAFTKFIYKRNSVREATTRKMPKEEKVANGSEKVEGIPLQRAEGLLLVMNTPKGAVSVTLPCSLASTLEYYLRNRIVHLTNRG